MAGQFTSADTTLAGGLNRYAYVGGAPTTFIDPTGHEEWVGCEGEGAFISGGATSGDTGASDGSSGTGSAGGGSEASATSPTTDSPSESSSAPADSSSATSPLDPAGEGTGPGEVRANEEHLHEVEQNTEHTQTGQSRDPSSQANDGGDGGHGNSPSPTRTPDDLSRFGGGDPVKPARPSDFPNLPPNSNDPNDGVIPAQTPPDVSGASTTVDPANAGLKGSYKTLPAGSPFPEGLDYYYDGGTNDLEPGHVTIYNTRTMSLREFNELLSGMNWQPGGKDQGRSHETPSEHTVWSALVEAKQQFDTARMKALSALRQNPAAGEEILRSALHSTSVTERYAALDALQVLNEPIRQALFPILMDLASCDTNWLFGARKVIQRMNRPWLEAHLPEQVNRILNEAPDEDHYRRLAELLDSVSSSHLTTLLERAKSSPDPTIREIWEDRNSQ